MSAQIHPQDREVHHVTRTLKAAEALCAVSEKIAESAERERLMRGAARRLVELSRQLLDDARELKRETSADFLVKAAEAVESLAAVTLRISDLVLECDDLAIASGNLRRLSSALLRDSNALRGEREGRS